MIKLLSQFLYCPLLLWNRSDGLINMPSYSIPSIHLNRSIMIYNADHFSDDQRILHLSYTDYPHLLQVKQHSHHILGADLVLPQDFGKPYLKALSSLVLNVL
jgi:CRISPR/Cas system-associated exonuclease Cas4 (RecB family)